MKKNLSNRLKKLETRLRPTIWVTVHQPQGQPYEEALSQALEFYEVTQEDLDSGRAQLLPQLRVFIHEENSRKDNGRTPNIFRNF